jgi:outer membrane protein OmpA-like peptidoglycan-associated protein
VLPSKKKGNIMAINLLDMLGSAVTPDLASMLGKAVGASDSAVGSAVSSLLPMLLGGMAHKAGTADGASGLFSLLTGNAVDSGIASTIGSVLGSGQTAGLLESGGSLLGSLFGGNKVGGLTDALGSIAGMGGGNAKNLAFMLAPMAFGMLKKYIGGNNMNASGVASLLRDQAPHLAGKIDPRLTAALGMGTPASMLAGLGEGAAAISSAATGAAGAAVGAAGAAATAGASGIGKILPWLIGGAVALFLVSQLGMCSTKKADAPMVAAPVVEAPAPKVAEPMAPPVVAVAPVVEAAPVVAAAPAALPAKIYFDTGKSDVGANGTASIAVVNAYLAADAAHKVSITGYTDKSGDTASNEKLAKARAVAVRDALQAAGVASDRIAMKPPAFVEVGATITAEEARRVEISAD